MQQLYNSIIVFLFYFISSTAWANYFTYIQQQAVKGNPVAQYTLGVMYQQAKSVKQNKQIALSWYKKSAAQNYLLAQYALIAIYQYGVGVNTSSEDTNYWYQKTTEPRSLSLLKTQQQQFIDITNFLEKLAIKNNTDAQYLLATLYAGNKDDETANYWFLKAAIAGDKNAQYYIGITYTDKQGLLNKTQGVYWLEKAAIQDYIDAEIVLGSFYEQGKEMAPNFQQAAYWYERAAKQGDAKAQSFIAGMYRDGKGVTLNSQEAFMWYKKAAKQGDAFSQYNLGQLYETGNGTEQNMKEAIYWYQQGAKQGHIASRIKLESLQSKL